MKDIYIDSWFMIICLFLIFFGGFLFRGCEAHADSLELSYQTGYHFAGMNSSDTFQYSGTDDTEFSGPCNLYEATYWLDKSWGIYGFYGRDRKISEDIYFDSEYKATTYYLGTGLRYQWHMSDNLLGYVGAGITEATLKHSYQTQSERLSTYGAEGVIGAKWVWGDGWGMKADARYSSYKMESYEFGGAYFKPGGLRAFCGFYWEFNLLS